MSRQWLFSGSTFFTCGILPLVKLTIGKFENVQLKSMRISPQRLPSAFQAEGLQGDHMHCREGLLHSRLPYLCFFLSGPFAGAFILSTEPLPSTTVSLSLSSADHEPLTH